MNLLVRFRVMDNDKALLSTGSLLLWLGDDLVRKASGTRIRCAWYLRAKHKPHSELPCAEGEDFLEVMSMDRAAGVRPVEEGTRSSSSDPAVPEDVEESARVKKLVTPSAPTVADREEPTASGHAVFKTWCRECCNVRGRMHQHLAGRRETVIPAIAIVYGFLNE